MARAILFAALALDAFVVLLFAAQPNYMVPMHPVPGPLLGWLILTIGTAWNLVGLGLMLRIYRADPEGHRSWWRFQGQ